MAALQSGLVFVFMLVISFVSAGSEEDDLKLFEQFMLRHKKSYISDSEKWKRFSIFQESLKRQEMLNRKEKSLNGSAIYGINKFSDLTQAEFSARCLGRIATDKGNRSNTPAAPEGPQSVPKAFDWREKGVVTSIKDQERCGSCWAFSIVETVESRAAILTLPLMELSPQQLLSCDHTREAMGCEGGDIDSPYKWLEKNPLLTESEYPFESKNGENFPCQQTSPKHGILVESFRLDSLRNNPNVEVSMLSYLSFYGPVAVAVNAINWQDYVGGVMQHHCSAQDLDHAVVIVGYSLQGEVPYWIVRNTWGVDWGLQGYAYIKYNSNICGIAEDIAFPVLVKQV